MAQVGTTPHRNYIHSNIDGAGTGGGGMGWAPSYFGIDRDKPTHRTPYTDQG